MRFIVIFLFALSARGGVSFGGFWLKPLTARDILDQADVIWVYHGPVTMRTLTLRADGLFDEWFPTGWHRYRFDTIETCFHDGLSLSANRSERRMPGYLRNPAHEDGFGCLEGGFLWSGAPLVIVDGSDFLTTEHRDRVLEEGRRLAGDDAVTMLRRSTGGGLSWSPRWDDRNACVQDLQIRSWIRVGELEVVNAVREPRPLVIQGSIEVLTLSGHFASFSAFRPPCLCVSAFIPIPLNSALVTRILCHVCA